MLGTEKFPCNLRILFIKVEKYPKDSSWNASSVGWGLCVDLARYRQGWVPFHANPDIGRTQFHTVVGLSSPFFYCLSTTRCLSLAIACRLLQLRISNRTLSVSLAAVWASGISNSFPWSSTSLMRTWAYKMEIIAYFCFLPDAIFFPFLLLYFYIIVEIYAIPGKTLIYSSLPSYPQIMLSNTPGG
jgi:hypothetical protein